MQNRHVAAAGARILEGQDLPGEIVDAPRAPAPRVAPDFWRQFDEAEMLDEVRKYRPAAFKRLPDAP